MGMFFSTAELADMSSGVCPPPPKDYQLPTAFPDLSKAGRIAYDLETHDPNISAKGGGVYRKDGYIVGGAIAAWDKEGKLYHAEYYPCRHRGGPNLDPDVVYRYFRDQLAFYDGEIVGANLLYDGDWSQSEGIIAPYAKWRDVQWAEALIDEMAYNYRLETLGQKYLHQGKVRGYLAEQYPDYIKRFQEVHPGHAREYGLGDVLLPNAILNEQYKELRTLGLVDLFHLESRLTPFLLYMRKQGVRVDLQKATEIRALLEDKRDQNLAEVTRLTGIQFTADNFNLPRLLTHLFDSLHIKYPTAKKGGPSFTDKWFDNLQHPVGRLLSAARRYDKAKSVFVDSYIFDCAVDGRIHGDFHPLRKSDDDQESGTESGRFSSTHPNLQNIPARDEEIGPLCRSMFVPEPGAEWWAIDYSQIEYRFLAHFATLLPQIKGSSEAAVRRAKAIEAAMACKAMYEKDPNTDFHQAVADLTGLNRKNAKNLNFGLVYGMGLQRLAATLNLLDANGKPLPEALTIMDTYHGKAPFIKEILDMCSSHAALTGEIRTILNRRSQFEFYEPAGKSVAKGAALPLPQAIDAWGFNLQRASTHKALNRKLQGSAADMIKLSTAVAWEAGVFTSTSDFTVSLQVHDEEDGSIFPTPRGQECYKELQHIMTTCMPLNVPVLVGAGIGENWADAK